MTRELPETGGDEWVAPPANRAGGGRCGGGGSAGGGHLGGGGPRGPRHRRRLRPPHQGMAMYACMHACCNACSARFSVMMKR